LALVDQSDNMRSAVVYGPLVTVTSTRERVPDIPAVKVCATDQLYAMAKLVGPVVLYS